MSDKYDAALALLMKAELAARNGEWLTCGTYAKQAAELAWGIKLEVAGKELSE